MRPIDKEVRSRRSFWTVGKRLVLTAGIAVMVGFGTTMTIQLTSEREKTRADMAASSEAITRLLAAQMSGGVRWKKGDAVAATYAELVQAPGSEIASILVLDDANAPLVSYKSDRIQPVDLTQAAGTLAKDRSAALTRTDDAHLIVVAPIHAGKDNDRVGTLAIAFGLDRLNSRLHANLVTGGLIAAGLLAVLMAVLAFLIGRVVSRPVTHMTKVMGQLADGNTTVTIPGAERRDEIGEMARAVEVFRESMIESARLRAEQEQLKARAEAERQAAMAKLAGTFEASVKKMVDSVSSSASQMRGTAGEMATAADQASAQTTAAAAASEQASANVQTVASAAEELSSSITEISRQVSESTKIAGQAVSEAERTNATVKSLADAAQRIGDVVKLISEIAGQTNLLALNATIEAARAGEAGKGFAVVASEVKSLATQTAKATEEIAAQIGAIQGATGQSVAAIEGISATIGRINEIATSIAAAVEEQGAATQEIARNVQEAARGTSEVSSNVNGISEVTSNTGRAAGLVLSAAEAVAQQTDKLSAEVAAFVTRVRAA